MWKEVRDVYEKTSFVVTAKATKVGLLKWSYSSKKIKISLFSESTNDGAQGMGGDPQEEAALC